MNVEIIPHVSFDDLIFGFILFILFMQSFVKAKPLLLFKI